MTPTHPADAVQVLLEDPVLDATDPQTRLLLLAEYWKRKYSELRVLAPAAAIPPAATMAMRDDTFTVIPQNMREYQMSVREADGENDLFRVAFEDACREDKPPTAEQEMFAWDFFKYGWEGAIRCLATPSAAIQSQPDAPRKKFNAATCDQIAAVLLMDEVRKSQPLLTKGAPTEQGSIGDDAEFKRLIGNWFQRNVTSDWNALVAYIMQWAARNHASAKDAERLDRVYQMAMVEPFIAPIATKDAWLASLDRAIATTKATK